MIAFDNQILSVFSKANVFVPCPAANAITSIHKTIRFLFFMDLFPFISISFHSVSYLPIFPMWSPRRRVTAPISAARRKFTPANCVNVDAIRILAETREFSR